jgi:regulator of protease activity HflC (stomatin/prohibitin superfamily)
VGILVLVIILFLGAIGLGVYARSSSGNWAYGLGAAACAGLALVILLFASINTVGPSDTGIVTAFGHVQGSDLGPGIHLLPPWDTVTIWDDSIQADNFTGKNCLTVRIDNQQTACAVGEVLWQDNRGNADSQFRNYRTFARVTNALVDVTLQREMNDVFETFDPVSEASSTAKPGSALDPEVSQLGAQVQAQMQAFLSGQITIRLVSVSRLIYNPQVEAALAKVTTAKANTNVALQNEQTAIAQRAADRELQLNLTPLVVAQNCINVTQTLSQEGNTLPIGWSCTGGAGVSILATK